MNGLFQNMKNIASNFYFPTKWYYILGILALFQSIFLMEYCYLTSLYLVDEIYEVDIPKEWSIDDKLTLRVVISDIEILKDFVSTYAICQCLHEIQVIIPVDKKTTTDYHKLIKYSKTHSLVSIVEKELETQHDKYYMQLYHDVPIATDSVLFLDSDVYMSCTDLKFSLSVFKSSQSSLVGYYPRMHRISSYSKNFEFIDHWSYLWYHQKYSLLLGAGVIVNKQYIHDIAYNSDVHSISHTKSKELKIFLEKYQECSELALNIWIASGITVIPNKHLLPTKPILNMVSDNSTYSYPIYVDIPLSYKTFPNDKQMTKYLPHTEKRNRDRSKCLNSLMDLLGVSELHYAQHKSVQSNTQWIW